MCLRRIRQIRAIPASFTSLGRNGSGKTRLKTPGSTLKFTKILRSMTPRMIGILIFSLFLLFML